VQSSREPTPNIMLDIKSRVKPEEYAEKLNKLLTHKLITETTAITATKTKEKMNDYLYAYDEEMPIDLAYNLAEELEVAYRQVADTITEDKLDHKTVKKTSSYTTRYYNNEVNHINKIEEANQICTRDEENFYVNALHTMVEKQVHEMRTDEEKEQNSDHDSDYEDIIEDITTGLQEEDAERHWYGIINEIAIHELNEERREKSKNRNNGRFRDTQKSRDLKNTRESKAKTFKKEIENEFKKAKELGEKFIKPKFNQGRRDKTREVTNLIKPTKLECMCLRCGGPEGGWNGGQPRIEVTFDKYNNKKYTLANFQTNVNHTTETCPIYTTTMNVACETCITHKWIGYHAQRECTRIPKTITVTEQFQSEDTSSKN